LNASAPPQNDSGTRPSSASVMRWASVTVSGCNALPDMYMLFSLAGNTGRRFDTSSVFDSLRPNRRPHFCAACARLRTICIASSNFGSWSNAASSTTTSNPMRSLRMPRRSSGPSSVGLSFTHVSMPRSSSMNRAILSISAGGQPCIVDSVTRLDMFGPMGTSRTDGSTAASASTTVGSSSLASRMRRKNRWTFSDRMPSRS
jgi:hypothetical protein